MIDVLVLGGIFREILDGDTTPKLRYGGSGLTASVAAARLGAQVALASYLGVEDEVAVRGELSTAGVQDDLIIVNPGASGTFLFPSHQDNDRPWPMYKPADSVPTERPSPIPASKIILVFGIPDYDPIAAGWLSSCDAGTTLMWDRQGWLSRARDTSGVLSLSPERKIYIAAEGEAVDDANLDQGEDVFAVQPPDGFSISVIKRGKEGVAIFERSVSGVRSSVIPAFVVDTSLTIGSGDVFAGAFAAGLAVNKLPVDASKWGCAAAAIALEEGNNLLGDSAWEKVTEMTKSA